MGAVKIVCRDFTPENCCLDTQPLLSLSVNESAFSDYDVASAVCVASSPLGLGKIVSTSEGGNWTGDWVVSSYSNMKNAQSFYMKDGAAHHYPMYSYKLMRKNWDKFRATLSECNLKSIYPPKFVSEEFKQKEGLKWDKDKERQKLEPRPYEGYAGTGWNIVSSGTQIAEKLASWFGVGLENAGALTFCPDTFYPLDQPLISALKQVAEHNGMNCWLNRNGNLQFFRYTDYFGGGNWNGLEYEWSREEVDGVPDITFARVIGDMGLQRYAEDGTPIAMRTFEWGGFVNTSAGFRIRQKIWRDIPSDQLTEAWASVGTQFGPYHVEARKEVSDYKLNPGLATDMARAMLLESLAKCSLTTVTGIAEHFHHFKPLQGGITTVARNLNHIGGGKYSYEISLEYINIEATITTYTPSAAQGPAGSGPQGGSFNDYVQDKKKQFPTQADFDAWWNSSMWASQEGTHGIVKPVWGG